MGPIIAATGIPWALIATFFIAPSFVKMFADFGAELPALTRFVLAPWGPLSLAFAVGAAALATMRKPVASIVLAVVGVLFEIGVFFFAMYLPIFSLAGNVR